MLQKTEPEDKFFCQSTWVIVQVQDNTVHSDDSCYVCSYNMQLKSRIMVI